MIASLLLLASFQAQVLVDQPFSSGLGSDWHLTARRVEASTVDGPPGSQGAVRFTSHATRYMDPWDVQALYWIKGSIQKGDTLEVHVQARSPNHGVMRVLVSKTAAPYTVELQGIARPGSDWRSYTFRSVAKNAYGPNEALTKLFFGDAPGDVDVANLQVLDLGQGVALPQISRNAEDEDRSWLEAAQDRIRAVRTGDLKIRVEDGSGNPVSGADVRVDQQTRNFRFGVAAPAHLFTDDDEDGRQFRDHFLRFFNTCTFPNELKWREGTPQLQAQVDAALPWMREHHVWLRGHNLVWGNERVLPPGLLNQDKDSIIRAIHERISSMLGKYKGQFYVWDVVNEAAPQHQLWDKIGYDQIARSFAWAKEADPGALTCLNEAALSDESRGKSNRKRSIDVVETLIKSGASFDVLGDQCHAEEPLTPIPTILNVWDNLAGYGKPIEITELDVDADNETDQANYLRDMLTAAYSEPFIQTIVLWGFWSPHTSMPYEQRVAVYNRDWTPKPAANVLEDLLRHQWWTNLTLTTNASGQASPRVFYGQQRVTVRYEGREASATVDVAPGADNSVVIRM